MTGSSDGIGKATALVLARMGAALILNARGAKRLEAARRELEATGAVVHAVCGDASVPAVARRLAAVAQERFGRLDILVNNAGGTTHARSFDTSSRQDWERTLRANLLGAFAVCHAVIPIMQRQRRGRIVNVSSLAGRQRSVLGAVDYASAKAGLIGLTRQLAGELGPWGITVNAVAPGLTSTPRVLAKWKKRTTKYRRTFLESIPLRRLAEPEEVAKAIVFLASDDASYISGATLDVNGGVFMG